MALIVAAPALAFPAAPAPPTALGPTPSGPAQPGLLGWVFIALTPMVIAALWGIGAIRPEALRRRARAVGAAPWWWEWLAGAFVVVFATGLGARLASALMKSRGIPLGSPVGTGLTTIAAYAVGVAAAVVLLRLLGRAAPGAGLRPAWGDAPRGLIALAPTLLVCAGASSAAVVVHTLVAGVPPDPVAHETLRRLLEPGASPWVWAPVAAAVFAAPVVEEVAYRACLQSGVLRLWGSPWAAAATSATAFALMHRLGPTPVPWHAVATLWVLGLALGIAYERTGRIGVPIVMHAGFNAVNVALALAMR